MDRRSTSTVRSIARKPMPRQRRSISTAGRRNKRTRWARLRRSTIFSDQDRTYFASDNLACAVRRSEEHTSELQSLMRTSYAVFCLKKKNTLHNANNHVSTIYSKTNDTIPHSSNHNIYYAQH